MSRRSGNAYHVTGGLMSFVLVAVLSVVIGAVLLAVMLPLASILSSL